jgi:protein ImuB
MVAEAGGVGAGLPLADARAVLPHLKIIEHEPAADFRALARLAGWAERYTPWTQIDHGDEGAGAGLWLDLTGCAHLFGGEAALLRDLTTRLGRQGFVACAGLADTPGAAWALARYGSNANRIAPEGGTRETLASVPVAALRLASADADGLARLGFRRIGDLYGLPRASLTRRFGARTVLRLDQALGGAEESISPRRPETPHCVRRLFAEPISAFETIAAAVKRLLTELKPLLEADGMGVRRLELVCHRVDDTLYGTEIGTSRPTRDPDHLFRLFALKLDRIDPGFGIEAMTLIALRAEPMDPRQLGLEARAAAADGAGDLAGLIDRIAGRLGADPVRRLDPCDSHWPERAQAAVPVFAPASNAVWLQGKARPPLLLNRPEPIEALAILPDSPPSQFRWRRRVHRVRAAEGPERFAPEWWRDSVSRTRDYYRVEDADGRRFWLFREGLYGEEGSAPRWWMHGMQ